MPRWTLARAKINLALHITGQRADGYHLIDSIVVFAGIADRVMVAHSRSDQFKVCGPEAGDLADDDPAENLVIRARDALRVASAPRDSVCGPVSIELEKNLPVQSGIGGGSADAAATLRALARLWKIENPYETLALRLGADVPMCLQSRPLNARGIGDELQPLGNVPQLHAVLVNPRIPVSTPAVFKHLPDKANAPVPRSFSDLPTMAGDWIGWLRVNTRNDLQAVSISQTPEILHCLATLEAEGALIARMSGSGATCYGLFEDEKRAERASDRLLRKHPDWWISATATAPSPETEQKS